jgi:predicted double-glycine peptidase
MSPRHFTLLFSLLLLCGCRSPDSFRGLTLQEATGGAVLLTAVPPLLQDKSVSCGPTCVSAVAIYWDINAAKIQTNNLGSYYRQEFTVEDLERLARGFGLTAYKYQGDLKDLEGNLRKGRPVIVLIPKPRRASPFQFTFGSVSAAEVMADPAASHWVIVIGMLKDTVVVQDPAFGRRTIPKGEFENTWQQRARTCLLLTRE